MTMTGVRNIIHSHRRAVKSRHRLGLERESSQSFNALRDRRVELKQMFRLEDETTIERIEVEIEQW
jgi:hypothetical protein